MILMDNTFYLEYQGDIDDIPRFRETQERFGIYQTNVSQTNLHYHDYAEISYFTGGSGFETINGVRHQLRQGTVSFLLPNHMHSISGAPGQQVSKYCCMFDVQLLFGHQEDREFSSLLDSIGTDLPSFLDFEGSDKERMKQIFEFLLEIFSESDTPFYRHLVRTKLTEAILIYIRCARRQQSRPNSLIANKESVARTQLFWPVLRYVHLHYRKPLSLEELAERFELSVSYIGVSFKKYTGHTFVKYIHHLRIETADNMLQHTNISVTDIAMEVGFESFRTFARVFRERKGITANQFRSLSKQKKDSDPV
ncbi:AraC family transcriptional regulator [Paenibacillus ginsengarvi]|uniref:AraC family transcriptional regulator n=2 Tax=Paenibacillus ginsengarvi TaxID=400777 RepID=A0A3B0CD07_9BACL|nr:AraC family transcriptional regulator [Paenibacillus ginsengarvi]